MKIKKRQKLTTDEWNTLMRVTKRLGLDTAFDVCEINKEKDGFVDYENGKRKYCLTTGLTWVYEAITAPCTQDGLTLKEGKILFDLFKEFGILKDHNQNPDNFAEWYIK